MMPRKNPLHLCAFLIFFSAHEGRSQPYQTANSGSTTQPQLDAIKCDSYPADREEWCPTIAPYACGDAGEVGRSVRSVCPTSCKICLVSHLSSCKSSVAYATRVNRTLSSTSYFSPRGHIHACRTVALSAVPPLIRLCTLSLIIKIPTSRKHVCGRQYFSLSDQEAVNSYSSYSVFSPTVLVPMVRFRTAAPPDA